MPNIFFFEPKDLVFLLKILKLFSLHQLKFNDLGSVLICTTPLRLFAVWILNDSNELR